MLFEVALIQKPTKKEAEEGKIETLIMPPTPVIADNDRTAGVRAIMLKKDTLTDDQLARVEVLVRPFA